MSPQSALRFRFKVKLSLRLFTAIAVAISFQTITRRQATYLRCSPGMDEFMDTMGMFSAALSMNCTDCHTKDSTSAWIKFADDTPLKQLSRKMVDGEQHQQE